MIKYECQLQSQIQIKINKLQLFTEFNILGIMSLTVFFDYKRKRLNVAESQLIKMRLAMYENVLTACDLSPLSAWRADSSFNSPQPESVFTVQSSCFRSDISDRSACRS